MAQSSNNQQEYEYYQQIKLLGEGSFGKAYLVKCQSDGTLCVIKKMEMKQMSEQEKQETVREAHILEALNHPNIVRFREVYKTKRNQLCIVMDYCDGGDLSKKILEFKGRFIPESQVLDWFTQVCLALKHVHDRKIVHRDLKAQNIFLMKDNTLKVGDFGIAKVLRHTRENCKTMVGTPYYISPEIIESKPYSFRSDIWSLGVILYEMCTQKPPFDGIGLSQLALKIVRGQYTPISSFYSKELSSLISVLLNVDPLKRPLINHILKMPIIHNRIKKFLSETVRQNEFSHTVLHNLNFVNNNLNIDNIPPPQPRPAQNQQQQQQPQLNPSSNQQILSRQPAQNVNNLNNNNGIGPYISPQGRNIPQQKPSQQNVQQPIGAVLGNQPQNQQLPSQNYQFFQNKPSQQQIPAQNNYINNKVDAGGYKINNNYNQNQPGVSPTPPLFMKIHADQQQQQQKQHVQNIGGGNNLAAQNALQKQQQLLNQQKQQFAENTNNNDFKKQNNINNPNAQDYYNGPIDKFRREVSEPAFIQKSKPLFDNLEQKKQIMLQKEKALEKKIEEIKAENKKAQQHNKFYENSKGEESTPQLNNNNYNPNNYKVNNIIPQTKREPIPTSQPSSLGQSKKNLKNQALQQPILEDKELKKQKREEERKSMQEDIKLKRQMKNSESQDSKIEFFQNLKPPKEEQNDNQSKESLESEIKKNQSSKKINKKDIPVEIFIPKTPYSGNINQQLPQQVQNNNQQNNNNKYNQKYNVSDYQSSPNKQTGFKELCQNSHGSKEFSQDIEDISYIPHENKEILKQLLELNLTDEEGVDSQFNSQNSDNSEKNEKQNRLVQELDKSVNEIQKKYNNDIERDDEEDDDANYIDSDLSSRLNNIKERDFLDSSESDDEYNERKSQSDFNDEREDYEKEWEICSSRKDSQYDDSEYFKEENVNSKNEKDKVQNGIIKNIDDNQNQKLIQPLQKQNKSNDSKQNIFQKSPQKLKNNYESNQQLKENIQNNINCQHTPSTTASSRSEFQNESKLDTLRFILEDKVGKLVLQSSLKQLKNHLSSLNNSQNKENNTSDQAYGMFNNLSKLFISMPQDLAEDYGPLIILYYNMSTQQDIFS